VSETTPAIGKLENALAHIEEIANAMDCIGQNMEVADGAPYLCFAHALQDHHAAAYKAFDEIIKKEPPKP
jgi:hypothetical protein